MMAVRDLRVYAEASYGTVSHYLDKNGLECDAIVHLRNGTYGLVEMLFRQNMNRTEEDRRFEEWLDGG